MYFGDLADGYTLWELVDSDGVQVDKFPHLPEYFVDARQQVISQSALKLGLELVSGFWSGLTDIPDAWGHGPWMEASNTLLRAGYRHYLLRRWNPAPTHVISAPSLVLPEDIDPATAALVASSIPAYRNSERCEKPGCNKTRTFVRMDFVCPEHG